MPKRTNISPILVIGMAALLVSCGNTGSRTETITVSGEDFDPPGCIMKFGKSADTWSSDPVRTSFVYDISALSEDAQTAFIGAAEENGSHDSVISDQNPKRTIATFLKNPSKSDTAFLQAGETALFRINSGPRNYYLALKDGCNRAIGNVTIRQVTFSQGKN